MIGPRYEKTIAVFNIKRARLCVDFDVFKMSIAEHHKSTLVSVKTLDKLDALLARFDELKEESEKGQ